MPHDAVGSHFLDRQPIRFCNISIKRPTTFQHKHSTSHTRHHVSSSALQLFVCLKLNRLSSTIQNRSHFATSIMLFKRCHFSNTYYLGPPGLRTTNKAPVSLPLTLQTAKCRPLQKLLCLTARDICWHFILTMRSGSSCRELSLCC
jgi:hypothetical protein